MTTPMCDQAITWTSADWLSRVACIIRYMLDINHENVF